jgi:uncharacterized membrane protein HdeD (DUF308 family)
MANSIIDTTKSVIKHWYLLLLVGLVFIAAGIWVMSTPLSAYLALSILFSVSFFIVGLLEVIFAISNAKDMKGWGWTLVFGIFNLLISFVLFYDPLISITTLPLYIGFVVLFRSFSAIGISLDSENYGVPGKGSLLALGILGVLFSFILLWDPAFAGLSLVVWTAIALITAGIYSIYFSILLKKLA